VREWTGPERAAITSQAAAAAAAFLKGIADPERAPAVVGARAAVERLTSELQAAQEAAAGAALAITGARAELHKALGLGKSTAKAWEAITSGERNVADARVRLELTEQAAGEATSLLAAARLAAIEAALPAAGAACVVARQGERDAELAFLVASRALGLVRSHAGSLAVHGDCLRSAVGGAK
jgi:hypothetical protein